MLREKSRPCFNHQILAVVDLGDKADYRLEVRFSLSLSVPFRLTGRSGIRQLQDAFQQVFKALHHILPTSRRRLHVWLIDPESGQPSLFLSDLLGVRQGQLTKKQAERLDAKIRPQVTCPCPFGRRARDQKWLWAGVPCGGPRPARRVECMVRRATISGGPPGTACAACRKSSSNRRGSTLTSPRLPEGNCRPR
jgi:hypothetical protein